MRWWFNKKKAPVAMPRRGDRVIVRQEYWDYNGRDRARARNEVPAVVYWVRKDGSFQIQLPGNKAKYDVGNDGTVSSFQQWRGRVYVPTESVKGKKRWMRVPDAMSELGEVGTEL
jgi:hypothetical protein